MTYLYVTTEVVFVTNFRKLIDSFWHNTLIYKIFLITLISSLGKSLHGKD